MMSPPATWIFHPVCWVEKYYKGEENQYITNSQEMRFSLEGYLK